MKFKPNQSNRCSYCGKSTLGAVESTEASNTSSAERNPSTRPRLVEQNVSPIQNNDLVLAQNRTTYAVRAIALFIIVQVQTAFLGGALIGLALTMGSDGVALLVFGYLIIVVGIAISIVVAYSELRKSQP